MKDRRGDSCLALAGIIYLLSYELVFQIHILRS